MGPCPRESCISRCRLEALRRSQKNIFEERVTVNMFFLKIGNVPVPEMGRRKRWGTHTLWGESYVQDLAV